MIPHDTRGESLALTSFFAKTWAVSEKSRIFAIGNHENTPSRQKNKRVSLFCSRLFVTLEEIAGFHYIKAMQRIEKIQGYEIETDLQCEFTQGACPPVFFVSKVV